MKLILHKICQQIVYFYCCVLKYFSKRINFVEQVRTSTAFYLVQEIFIVYGKRSRRRPRLTWTDDIIVWTRFATYEKVIWTDQDRRIWKSIVVTFVQKMAHDDDDGGNTVPKFE